MLKARLRLNVRDQPHTIHLSSNHESVLSTILDSGVVHIHFVSYFLSSRKSFLLSAQPHDFLVCCFPAYKCYFEIFAALQSSHYNYSTIFSSTELKYPHPWIASPIALCGGVSNWPLIPTSAHMQQRRPSRIFEPSKTHLHNHKACRFSLNFVRYWQVSTKTLSVTLKYVFVYSVSWTRSLP